MAASKTFVWGGTAGQPAVSAYLAAVRAGLPDAGAGLLPPPTPEQLAVCQDAAEQRHVSIEAQAGSGKSTVLLMAALCYLAPRDGEAWPTDAAAPRALVLAYNRAVAEGLRKRVARLGLANRVVVRTLHAWLAELYRRPVANDLDLLGVLGAGPPPPGALGGPATTAFACVLVDEAQDWCVVYARALRQALQLIDLGAYRRVRFCCVGDRLQMLYPTRARGTHNLLCQAPQWLSDVPPGASIAATAAAGWQRRALNVSQRLPRRGAALVNALLRNRATAPHAADVVSWADRAVHDTTPAAEGRVAVLFMTTRWGETDAEARMMHATLAAELDRLGLGFQDAMYVATSVRFGPAAALRRQVHLESRVAVNDNGAYAGRDAFDVLTVNQAKGLEKAVVLVDGLKAMPYFADEAWPEPTCSSATAPFSPRLNVSLTRARQTTVLVLRQADLGRTYPTLVDRARLLPLVDQWYGNGVAVGPPDGWTQSPFRAAVAVRNARAFQQSADVGAFNNTQWLHEVTQWLASIATLAQRLPPVAVPGILQAHPLPDLVTELCAWAGSALSMGQGGPEGGALGSPTALPAKPDDHRLERLPEVRRHLNQLRCTLVDMVAAHGWVERRPAAPVPVVDGAALNVTVNVRWTSPEPARHPVLVQAEPGAAAGMGLTETALVQALLLLQAHPVVWVADPFGGQVWTFGRGPDGEPGHRTAQALGGRLARLRLVHPARAADFGDETALAELRALVAAAKAAQAVDAQAPLPSSSEPPAQRVRRTPPTLESPQSLDFEA